MNGHYVRDPFVKRAAGTNSKRLRQQSRPWARMMRDTGLSKHSSLLVMVGGLLAIGFTMSLLGNLTPQMLPSGAPQVLKPE
jgi:hypothetical protein